MYLGPLLANNKMHITTCPVYVGERIGQVYTELDVPSVLKILAIHWLV